MNSNSKVVKALESLKVSAVTANNQSPLKQTNFNHFVARFTSRPWLLGTNQFCMLTTVGTTVEARPAGPKNWGGEENLYSQDVENAFEKIESKLAQLQRKLECGSRPDDDERYAWAMWLLASYLRTPAAFLCSAEVSTSMLGFTGDIFRTSYRMLAKCVTNPHCLELLANRNWQILRCEKPYFLKPDTGLVLTDRLDKEDCLILYPLSPFACFLATGRCRGFSDMTVHKKRVFGLNNHILRWSEKSVAASMHFWKDQKFMLRHSVRINLGTGKYSPPTSGRFFSIETVKCDGKLHATILSPRGPTLIAVPESAVRPVAATTRPQIPGLYDMEDCSDVSIEVRSSDNEEEIDYVSAASIMLHIGGRDDLAVDFARKALRKDEKNMRSKLIILACDPSAEIGVPKPENPDDAAELAIWWALAKHQPLEGLKITSAWLRGHSDHKRLVKANFLCLFMEYGVRFFDVLCGKKEKLPYLDDSTPIPDGVLDLLRKAFSCSNGKIVSEIQLQIESMDPKASGFVADLLRVCGLNGTVRFYRQPL
jgi:hypothetical protein